jgi:hypothetical protein
MLQTRGQHGQPYDDKEENDAQHEHSKARRKSGGLLVDLYSGGLLSFRHENLGRHLIHLHLTWRIPRRF